MNNIDYLELGHWFFLQKQKLNTAIQPIYMTKDFTNTSIIKRIIYMSTLRQLFYKYNISFCKGDVGGFSYQVEFGRPGQNVFFFFFSP